MARKALKNIPKPDEEKLKALYSNSSKATQSPSPSAVSKENDSDYKYTNPHDPPLTSKQVNITASKQGYTPPSAQPYETTSGHVYTPPPEQRVVVTQKQASSHAQASDGISAPSGQYAPQGYVPGQDHTEMSVAWNRQKPEPYRRQTYHLRPDQIEQIRVEAFHTRRKISQVVRDIIDQYYQHKRQY